MQLADRVMKTDLGLAELRERARGYSQRIRMVLFLADGERTAGEIAAQLPAVPEVPLILEALEREGLLTVQRVPAPATVAPEPEDLPIDGDIRRAIAGLSRYLHDALGPEADPLAVQIERARTRGEFAQAVRRAIATLQSAIGQTPANQFQARAQAILDTFFVRR